jgi:hypothetical protein
MKLKISSSRWRSICRRHGCGGPGGVFSVVAKIPGFSTAELTRVSDGTTPGGLVKTVCIPAGSFRGRERASERAQRVRGPTNRQ